MVRRRVVRATRGALAALGVGLLLWLPASFFVAVAAHVPVPGGDARGHCAYGALNVSRHSWTVIGRRIAVWDVNPAYEVAAGMTRDALFPRIHRERSHPFGVTDYTTRGTVQVTIPLWLLAALCLAWPVTSILLRRRRRRRGFPVEAAAGEPAGSGPPAR